MSTADNFYQNILDSLYDGVYFVDRDRKITYWNRGAERISGYESSEVVGRCCADNLLMHVDDKGVNLCNAGCPLAQTIIDGEVRETEVYLQHKDGHRLPVFVRVSPLRDSSGRIVGAVEAFSDNSSKTELIQRIEDLQEMALVDPLTGLANRRCIHMKLRSRIDEMKRYGWTCGVLFIDVDHFKTINDSYGHNIGDSVLMMIARTLSSNLRSYDLLGRYGGEEFVAIIASVNTAQLYSFANRLRVLVEQSSLTSEYGKMRATVSIGATVAQPTDTVEAVIARADQFMYQSKAGGRNRVSVDPTMEQDGEDLIRRDWAGNRLKHDGLTASPMKVQTWEEIVLARAPKKERSLK